MDKFLSEGPKVKIDQKLNNDHLKIKNDHLKIKNDHLKIKNDHLKWPLKIGETLARKNWKS